jgi:hypothetical protein
MSTGLGSRYEEKRLSVAIEETVKGAIVACMREHGAVNPGVINGALVSIIGEGIAMALVSDRFSNYENAPWPQRSLKFYFRVFTAIYWLARCTTRSIWLQTKGMDSLSRSDPNWMPALSAKAQAYHAERTRGNQPAVH